LASRRIRIPRAAALITEVALALGFQSLHRFDKAFQGVSPAKCRKFGTGPRTAKAGPLNLPRGTLENSDEHSKKKQRKKAFLILKDWRAAEIMVTF
jgi:hypothetical protein